MKDFSFSKDLRLRKQKEIREIFQSGSFRRLGLIGAKYRSTEHPYCRFLVSVSKSVGNAPERNRIKRLMREAIRLNKNTLEGNYDICFFVNKSPRTKPAFTYVEQKISQMFSELNELSKKS